MDMVSNLPALYYLQYKHNTQVGIYWTPQGQGGIYLVDRLIMSN